MLYRVIHLLRDLGWVDLNFWVFHCLPNSAWLMGIWQKWMGS